MKGHLNAKQLEKYNREDLEKLATELGVSTAGTKKDIAARCAEIEVELPDTDGQQGTDNPPDTDGQQGTDNPPDTDGQQGTDNPPDTDEQQGTDNPPDTDEQQGTDNPPDTDGQQNTQQPASGLVKVACIQNYKDLQFDRIVETGEEYEVTPERAALLLEKNLVKRA